MNWWQYLLLVNLYLVLFYGFYSLLLAKETFFHLNRVYLLSTALLAFFIPLIHSDWVKSLFITQKVQHTLSLVYSSGPIVVYHFKPIEDRHVTMGQIIWLVYATGIIVLVVKLVRELILLQKFISTPNESSAFTFFRRIKLGNKLSNRAVIAAHEEVHARQLHTLDVLLIELIAIINWFNPVVYFYRLSIKHIHEFIADKQALQQGTDKSEYALLLLSETLNAHAHQLVNPFFNHSMLKRRIIMLQKNPSQRTALLKYGLSAPLFILMLILSSATISKNKVIAFANNKIQQVFWMPAIKSKKDKQANLSSNTLLRQTKDEKFVETSQNISKQALNDASHNDQLFLSVENEPQFKGGLPRFYEFMGVNLRYPDAMREHKVQGKVFIAFTVERNGALSDIQCVRDIGYGAAEEAIRVLKLSPQWIPGMQNGRLVRVRYTLPISFVCDEATTITDTIASNKRVEEAATNTNIIKATYNNISLLKPLKNPLYILDGKEVADINDIDSANIESISVLRPTAPEKNTYLILYGDKAKNGVVIVNTKKAKP